jgi:hypothetical protein
VASEKLRGRRFRHVTPDHAGGVDGETMFDYHEDNNGTQWAQYRGGSVARVPPRHADGQAARLSRRAPEEARRDRRRRRRWAALVVALSGVTATACGADGGSSSTTTARPVLTTTTSSTTTTTTGRAAALGQTVSMRVGESVSIPSAGLSLTYTMVVSDSRCPPRSQCIVEGEASIAVAVAKDGMSPASLTIGAPGTARYGRYTVAVVGLGRGESSIARIKVS